MIDILNNPSKDFRLKKTIKAFTYYLDKLEEGTLLVPVEVELGTKDSCVIFRVSKNNNLDALADKIEKSLIEEAEKEHAKKKKLYQKIIKIWEERPSIFKKKKDTFPGEDIYKCSIDNLFTSKERNLAFSTGWGSNTYHSKKYYEDELKKFDDYCAKEISDIKKRKKSNLRDVLSADIEIKSAKLDELLTLETKTTTSTKKVKKPKFPFVFDPEFFNYLLDNAGDDFEVDDEVIDMAKKDGFDKLAKQLETIKGAVFSTSHEGDHSHDGQMCDYTVSIMMPDNTEYHAYETHCLMTGWNFHEPVQFN